MMSISSDLYFDFSSNKARKRRPAEALHSPLPSALPGLSDVNSMPLGGGGGAKKARLNSFQSQSPKSKPFPTSGVNAMPIGQRNNEAQNFASYLMDCAFGPGSEDSFSSGKQDPIPSLLDLPGTWKDESQNSESSYNPKRPADVLGNHITPRDVYDELPENIKRTLEQIKGARRGSSEQTGRLKFHVNNLMMEGKNPFPVIRLYKEFIGSEQLGRVLNAGMVRKLDFYWDNWEVPAPNPDFYNKGGGARKGPNWMTVEKLGPPRDAPHILKDDPLSYKPEEINGVGRDPKTGKYVTTTATIRWIRATSFTICRSGKKEEQYEPFMKLMRKYFGLEVVQKAINESQLARHERAIAAFLADEKGQEDWKASEPATAEADQLRWLMHNLTSKHIPGMTGEESRTGFSVESSTWIKKKTERLLAVCLSPDPFLRKLSDMYGEGTIKRVFPLDVARTFAAAIGNLPGTVKDPVFLMKLIKLSGTEIPERATPASDEASAPATDTGLVTFDYLDKAGSSLELQERYRMEREKYEEYRSMYEQNMIGPRPRGRGGLMPIPRPRHPMLPRGLPGPPRMLGPRMPGFRMMGPRMFPPRPGFLPPRRPLGLPRPRLPHDPFLRPRMRMPPRPFGGPRW